MALISKMNRCAVCGSSSVVYNEESRTYHCASCGSDCSHTMAAADLALINRIAALGDLKGEMPELRKRYPRLEMTTWTRENRVQA